MLTDRHTGSERHVGGTELCPDSGCSPQGERLFSQFLPPLQFFQTSVKDRPGKASPSAQLYLPPVPSSHIEGSSQPISGLPGASLYKLQLGFFSEDFVPACKVCR